MRPPESATVKQGARERLAAWTVAAALIATIAATGGHATQRVPQIGWPASHARPWLLAAPGDRGDADRDDPLVERFDPEAADEPGAAASASDGAGEAPGRCSALPLG